MQILAIANHKGGVAKSTTAYYLANHAAERNILTLLLDLDPQADLTRMCGREPSNAMSLVMGGVNEPDTDIVGVIQNTTPHDDDLWLVAADASLANAEAGLYRRSTDRTTVLRDALAQAEADGHWDLAIIDCPANMTALLAVNALVAATHILIPAKPEPAEISNLRDVVDLAEQIRTKRARDAAALGLALSPAMAARPVILGTVATMVAHYGDNVSRNHQHGLRRLGDPDTPDLLGEVPLWNGQDRDERLRAAYAAIADTVFTRMDQEVARA